MEGQPKPCTVFSGDVFAPSLMSTVTKGKHMVKYLNMMGITAACIGNHDFDFGTENLVRCVVLRAARATLVAPFLYPAG